MDTLTHIALGACLGELIAGRQLGKKAMLVGAVANNIPDADVIVQLWMDEASGMLAHRGITHSIVFVSVCSFFLAWLSKKIFSPVELSFTQWLIPFSSGMFSHIFIDAFTMYGTGWFEPFHPARISFNTLFIIDPVFTIPLLISSIALLILKRDTVKRIKWAKTGLLISTVYLGLTVINKIYVSHIIEKNLAEQQLTYESYISTPTPFNNLLWFVAVRNGSGYYTGYYSNLDGDTPIDFESISRNDSLLNYMCDSMQVQKLIRFSQNYYCYTKQNNDIYFNDMRFGQNGGWYKKQAPFIFNFYLQNDSNCAFVLQQARYESFNMQSMKKLFERIKGK